MDGLHLTSLIRKEGALDQVPVVLFSSLATDDNKAKWKNLGATDILTKPDLAQPGARRRTALSFKGRPELSVIVPVLQRRGNIAPFLREMARQREVRIEADHLRRGLHATAASLG